MIGMLSATQAISFASNWAKVSWVYVYFFSDAANSKMGFGAYSPTNSTPLSEFSEAGSFDMTPYEGTHSVRIGTNNNNGENVSSIRKMVIFKGLAISQSSSSPSTDDVLNCKRLLSLLDPECPKIILSATNPACSDLYVYYSMQPSSFANSDQEILDQSGNNIHAMNGATSGSEATDSTRQATR